MLSASIIGKLHLLTPRDLVMLSGVVGKVRSGDLTDALNELNSRLQYTQPYDFPQYNSSPTPSMASEELLLTVLHQLHTSCLEMRAMIWLSEVHVFINKHQYSEALQLCDQLIHSSHGPWQVHAWQAKGVALTRLGRFEDAVVSCQTALNHTSTPNDLPLHFPSICRLHLLASVLLCHDNTDVSDADHNQLLRELKTLRPDLPTTLTTVPEDTASPRTNNLHLQTSLLFQAVSALALIGGNRLLDAEVYLNELAQQSSLPSSVLTTSDALPSIVSHLRSRIAQKRQNYTSMVAPLVSSSTATHNRTRVRSSARYMISPSTLHLTSEIHSSSPVQHHPDRPRRRQDRPDRPEQLPEASEAPVSTSQSASSSLTVDIYTRLKPRRRNSLQTPHISPRPALPAAWRPQPTHIESEHTPCADTRAVQQRPDNSSDENTALQMRRRGLKPPDPQHPEDTTKIATESNACIPAVHIQQRHNNGNTTNKERSHHHNDNKPVESNGHSSHREDGPSTRRRRSKEDVTKGVEVRPSGVNKPQRHSRILLGTSFVHSTIDAHVSTQAIVTIESGPNHNYDHSTTTTDTPSTHAHDQSATNSTVIGAASHSAFPGAIDSLSGSGTNDCMDLTSVTDRTPVSTAYSHASSGINSGRREPDGIETAVVLERLLHDEVATGEQDIEEQDIVGGDSRSRYDGDMKVSTPEPHFFLSITSPHPSVSNAYTRALPQHLEGTLTSDPLQDYEQESPQAHHEPHHRRSPQRYKNRETLNPPHHTQHEHNHRNHHKNHHDIHNSTGDDDGDDDRVDATILPRTQVVYKPSTETGYYSLSVLRSPGPYPPYVHPALRETYLSPTDFHTCFGMSREAFRQLPKWKQVLRKKALRLF